MDKFAKWLVWIGCALLLAGSFLHLYGYTFTDKAFAGTGVQPDVILVMLGTT